MRKLIRSKTSKQFLTKDGAWTDQLQMAAVFFDLLAVKRALLRHNLRKVDLYFSFSADQATKYDFTASLQ